MDRANSFVGRSTRGASIDEGKDLEGVVAVVDPFSTGAHLANEIRKKGFKCARVLSAWDSPVASLVMEGLGDVDFCATIQHNDRLEEQDIAIQQVIILPNYPFVIFLIKRFIDCYFITRFTVPYLSCYSRCRNWCRIS